ncbi:MAG: hypothetical protein ACI4QJ_05495 [Candidatus Spyradenecus sp.]
MRDWLLNIARRLSDIALTVVIWTVAVIGFIVTTYITILIGGPGIAIWWTCDKCQRSGVWPIANISHARTPCESSSTDVYENLSECICLAQPCAILYDGKWRTIRPYRLGLAANGGHFLVRAIECSERADRQAPDYRTYRADKIRLISRLPAEPPYRFETRIYGPDSTIAEPMMTAPTPEAIGIAVDDISNALKAPALPPPGNK